MKRSGIVFTLALCGFACGTAGTRPGDGGTPSPPVDAEVPAGAPPLKKAGEECDTTAQCGPGLQCDTARRCVATNAAILDGTPDTDDSYPQVVRVEHDGTLCTGTLIGPRTVLTAGHCVAVPQTGAGGGTVLDANHVVSSVDVVFVHNGKQHRKGIPLAHPSFAMQLAPNGNVIASKADVAAITLSDCAPPDIAPFELAATAPKIQSGVVVTCRIVGFGLTGCDAGATFGDRLYGDTFVIGVDAERITITSTLTIGGHSQSGSVVWKGDSGGPLLCAPGTTFQVTGVASTSDACTGGSEGGYANVAAIAGWVTTQITDAAKCCTPSCAGKQCGADGCGGSCGSCSSNSSCNSSGQCVPNCTPSCAGKQCGADGCGGSCGSCSSGYKCSGGQCQLDCGGLTDCGGQCVNTSSNPKHCGGCNVACPSGFGSDCYQQKCVCWNGQNCGGVCVDTSNDNNNCGSCGHTCTANQKCSGGYCIGSNPGTDCSACSGVTVGDCYPCGSVINCANGQKKYCECISTSSGYQLKSSACK